ncbi:helix-turn-helix domain-containing protein [Lipingzhangella halophila]|uniref:helix-turn-helix domain-containing protein n=1 Tax=Lipingzhangella halophila TaxID=1783352 RepID=UPI0035E45A9E
MLPRPRLSRDERVRIETLWCEGLGFAAIGRRIGRPRCTVWREAARNHSYRHGPKNPRGARRGRAGAGGLYRWGYRMAWARVRAHAKARRPKRAKCARRLPRGRWGTWASGCRRGRRF